MTIQATETQIYLLWTVDGELYGGTLRDYAHNVEAGHYSGLDVGEPYRTFVDDGGRPSIEQADLVVERSEPWDDIMTVTFRVGGEEASYRLDLRA